MSDIDLMDALMRLGPLASQYDCPELTDYDREAILVAIKCVRIVSDGALDFVTKTAEARRLLGWAHFNATKGNSEAAATLIAKAQQALGKE